MIPDDLVFARYEPFTVAEAAIVDAHYAQAEKADEARMGTHILRANGCYFPPDARFMRSVVETVVTCRRIRAARDFADDRLSSTPATQQTEENQ